MLKRRRGKYIQLAGHRQHSLFPPGLNQLEQVHFFHKAFRHKWGHSRWFHLFQILMEQPSEKLGGRLLSLCSRTDGRAWHLPRVGIPQTWMDWIGS